MLIFFAQLFQLRQASETEAYIFVATIVGAIISYAVYYNYRKKHPKISSHHIAVLREKLSYGETKLQEARKPFSTRQDIEQGAVLTALIAGCGVFTLTVVENNSKWLVLKQPDWKIPKRHIKKRSIVLFYEGERIFEIHGRIKKVKRRTGLRLFIKHRMHVFSVKAHPGRGEPLGISCYISPYKAVSKLERVMGSVSSGTIRNISFYGCEIATSAAIDGNTDLLAEFKFNGEVYRVSGKVVRVVYNPANRILHLRFYHLDDSVRAVVRHLVGLASH